jgi:hypothetical protein
MPVRVRLVVTAGALDGRGHLGRALSLAEARWAPETVVELELLADALSARERSRAREARLEEAVAGSPQVPDTFAVVDVPDPRPVAARFEPQRLVVFDDRELFDEAAAVVIQPSQPGWSGPGEAGVVLAGYEYVPIPAAIRRRRSSEPSTTEVRYGPRPRVLVCFGGSDPARVTARLGPALAASLDAEVEIIVGPSYQGSTNGWPVPVQVDPPDLVERLATADIVLLGAGTMKFEAACLGRPMLLLAVADDQLPVGPAFAATGAARFLGDGRTIAPDTVVQAVAALIADPRARAELGQTAASVVDGNGADRIATVIGRLAQLAGSS